MAYREYEIEADDGRYYQVGASVEAWGDDAPRIDIEEVRDVNASGATRHVNLGRHPELVKEFRQWIEAQLDSQDIAEIQREDDETMRECAEGDY